MATRIGTVLTRHEAQPGEYYYDVLTVDAMTDEKTRISGCRISVPGFYQTYASQLEFGTEVQIEGQGGTWTIVNILPSPPQWIEGDEVRLPDALIEVGPSHFEATEDQTYESYGGGVDLTMDDRSIRMRGKASQIEIQSEKAEWASFAKDPNDSSRTIGYKWVAESQGFKFVDIAKEELDQSYQVLLWAKTEDQTDYFELISYPQTDHGDPINRSASGSGDHRHAIPLEPIRRALGLSINENTIDQTTASDRSGLLPPRAPVGVLERTGLGTPQITKTNLWRPPADGEPSHTYEVDTLSSNTTFTRREDIEEIFFTGNTPTFSLEPYFTSSGLGYQTYPSNSPRRNQRKLEAYSLPAQLLQSLGGTDPGDFIGYEASREIIKEELLQTQLAIVTVGAVGGLLGLATVATGGAVAGVLTAAGYASSTTAGLTMATLSFAPSALFGITGGLVNALGITGFAFIGVTFGTIAGVTGITVGLTAAGLASTGIVLYNQATREEVPISPDLIKSLSFSGFRVRQVDPNNVYRVSDWAVSISPVLEPIDGYTFEQ